MPAPTAWLDLFFEAYYTHRPVNATFIGRHEHDHRLPDLSENGAGDTLAGMQTLLREAATLERPPAGTPEAHDLRLAEGFLRIQSWEYASRHFHQGNPSHYTGEALFGLIGLFLTDYAPLPQRVDAAISRLHATPQLLEQGRRHVTAAPPGWTARALDECRGATKLLTDGLDRLCTDHQIDRPALRNAAAVALQAFTDYAHHLETTLRHRTDAPVACGAEAFARYLREGHCLDQDAEEIARYAEDQLAEANAHLAAHAADFGVSTPAEALAQLANHHPTAEQYLGRYQEYWDQVRVTAEAHDLVTWPDVPIRYVPRPPWTRQAAPHLYFLFYRAPAAYQRPPVHDYLVTPIGADLPPEEQARRLRATNDSVIKLNHVIHHGSIGHHVQNHYAYRAPSRIGRVAAVDCASRIAMFCGGTMAEGWACYATDLMHEFGMLTPLEAYAEQQSRARMCARAVVDVRLHTGRMTHDEAARYYAQRAGMPEAAARREAVKNSMFPGAALMYLMGTDGLHGLRREMSARQGADFSLRSFHDAVLRYGSLPVALIRQDMIAQHEQAQHQPTQHDADPHPTA